MKEAQQQTVRERPGALPRHGFTIIELLVVIAIIALLIAILLPALSRARYSAKIAQCASDKHQWGVLINAYAMDHDGWYPQDDIPATTGANPWDVPKVLTDSMIDYGMANPSSWFCPADQKQMDKAIEQGKSYGAPNVLTDFDDLKIYLTENGRWKYHLLPLHYWVPRKDEHRGPPYFPAIANDPKHPDGWATATDDTRGVEQPILTDKVFGGGPDLDRSWNVNGHRFADGRLESSALLFGDGRVEIRQREDIEARYGTGVAPRGKFYSFY